MLKKLKNLLDESIEVARRRKNLIIFFAAAHVVFLLLGQWMVSNGSPGALLLREEQMKMVQDLPFLKPLTGMLADSLVLKIAYTFFFNLIFGAFFSTTLMGFVFFLPYVIAVWRSFIIGVIVAGLDISPFKFIIFYGTFILEFGAYCLSSVAGTEIGLSLIWPSRKGTTSRKEAFSICLYEGKRLYILIIIILFLAAIWEMGWLHYYGPFFTHTDTLNIDK